MMIEKPKKEKKKRHKMTIACDISPEVRKIVQERDGNCSVVSGKTECLEVAHYIPRSQCGLGIPENLALLTKQEHIAYDNGNDEVYQSYIGAKIEQHLRQHYPNWNKDDLVYDKWKDLDPAWRFDNSVR